MTRKQSWKYWRKTSRKILNRLALRLFETRQGRRLLIESMTPRVVHMTLDAGDHLMTFAPADYIGRKVFRKGHFERERVNRLMVILRERGLIRKNTALLELGGNIGTQTLYFALEGSFKRIVSVEPDPRNFALLQTNIRQNNFADLITAVHCAAGDHEGDIDFYLNINNHGKSSVLQQSATDRKISVAVKPVSRILQDVALDPAEIGLIWMDVEGYEPAVCRSMEMLLTRQTCLYLEFTPDFYGAETASFIRYLSQFYSDCIMFHDNHETIVDVGSLPNSGPQFDILLMP